MAHNDLRAAGFAWGAAKDSRLKKPRKRRVESHLQITSVGRLESWVVSAETNTQSGRKHFVRASHSHACVSGVQRERERRERPRQTESGEGSERSRKTERKKIGYTCIQKISYMYVHHFTQIMRREKKKRERDTNKSDNILSFEITLTKLKILLGDWVSNGMGVEDMTEDMGICGNHC